MKRTLDQAFSSTEYYQGSLQKAKRGAHPPQAKVSPPLLTRGNLRELSSSNHSCSSSSSEWIANWQQVTEAQVTHFKSPQSSSQEAKVDKAVEEMAATRGRSSSRGQGSSRPPRTSSRTSSRASSRASRLEDDLQSSKTSIAIATYRQEVLVNAGIDIDITPDEIPTELAGLVDEILMGDSSRKQAILPVAERLLEKARKSVRSIDGEPDCYEPLEHALGELRPATMDSKQQRHWLPALKPVVLKAVFTKKRRRESEQAAGNQVRLSQPTTGVAEAPVDVPTGQTSPTAKTTTPSPRQAAEQPGQAPTPLPSDMPPPPAPATKAHEVKDPRPDICLGFNEEALDNAIQSSGVSIRNFLGQLQSQRDEERLISMPTISPSGIRFPFVIIQGKSAALSGKTYHAQNQAAVGGAGILKMFRDLDHFAGPSETPISPFPPYFSFSITTEGAVYELWVHWSGTTWTVHPRFCMACIGCGRLTIKKQAIELVESLDAILQWGHAILLPWLVEKVRLVNDSLETTLERV